jgi:hypothetical protein
MPPPGDDFDAAATADLLEELASAVRSGRLAEILEGEGLTKTTIEELLWLDGTTRLKAILPDPNVSESEIEAEAEANDAVRAEVEAEANDAARAEVETEALDERDPCRSEGGKLLPFRSNKGSRA